MNLLEYYGMTDHPGIDLIEYSTDEEWLEERTKGIGGSDAAAVLGMSKYTSPLKLYRIKLGEVKQDLSDNVYVKKGKDLEALIRNQYVAPMLAENEYELRHPKQMFVNRKTPWLRANCDGIAVHTDPTRQICSENIIIEIKWVSEWGEANWYGEDYYGVPPEYYAQVQHYMHTTGARKALICALFDKNWEMHYFEIPYDAAFVERLVKETYNFYNFHMEMKIPPKVTASLDKEEILARTYVESEPTVVGDADFENLVADYLDLKARHGCLEKELTAKYNDIIAKYLEGYRSNLVKISISRRVRVGFDSARFAEDYPELCAQYQKSSEYTVNSIRKK